MKIFNIKAESIKFLVCQICKLCGIKKWKLFDNKIEFIFNITENYMGCENLFKIVNLFFMKKIIQLISFLLIYIEQKNKAKLEGFFNQSFQSLIN